MESSGQQNPELGQDEEAQRIDPLPYRLLGKLIVLAYVGGPYWDKLEDPYDIARGTVEAREGVFFLEEVGVMGIVVRKVVRDADWGSPGFMPWSAIHSIYPVPSDEESEGEQEQEES